MAETQIQNKHPILSFWIIACGMVYIFAYQFKLPFAADVCLYGMVAGLVAMTLLYVRITITWQGILAILVALTGLIGWLYTIMPEKGLREAILFAFFAGVLVLSFSNSALIKSFTKWIYLVSIVVVLSSVLHFLAPEWFNDLMGKVLREDAYAQLMWSYDVDSAFAGFAAYTPNTTFSAAIVFGYSFLCVVNKQESPVIKNKLINIVLLSLSMVSIIICSKRGIFVATLAALFVLMLFLYWGKNFILKFLGVAALAAVLLFLLYATNEFVASFLNRFVEGDIMTGRDVIIEVLMEDFARSNILIGRGTGGTYWFISSGAHNIYIQILYDHGLFFSIPYYAFLLYNYYLAFKNKSPLSIFVQTMFLVYGLSGNPLYSNMFMLIYIYYALYAAKMQDFVKTDDFQGLEIKGKVP